MMMMMVMMAKHAAYQCLNLCVWVSVHDAVECVQYTVASQTLVFCFTALLKALYKIKVLLLLLLLDHRQLTEVLQTCLKTYDDQNTGAEDDSVGFQHNTVIERFTSVAEGT